MLITKKVSNFADVDRPSRARSWALREGIRQWHLGKRLLYALSWRSEIWKIIGIVKNAANRRCRSEYDVFWLKYADSAQALAFGTFIFNVRLCRFARSTIPGNSRASERGTGNKRGLTLFLFIHNHAHWAVRHYIETCIIYTLYSIIVLHASATECFGGGTLSPKASKDATLRSKFGLASNFLHKTL